MEKLEVILTIVANSKNIEYNKHVRCGTRGTTDLEEVEVNMDVVS